MSQLDKGEVPGDSWQIHMPRVTQHCVLDVYPRPGDSPCWHRMAISLLRHLVHCCRQIPLTEGVQTSYLADKCNNARGTA